MEQFNVLGLLSNFGLYHIQELDVNIRLQEPTSASDLENEKKRKKMKFGFNILETTQLYSIWQEILLKETREKSQLASNMMNWKDEGSQSVCCGFNSCCDRSLPEKSETARSYDVCYYRWLSNQFLHKVLFVLVLLTVFILPSSTPWDNLRTWRSYRDCIYCFHINGERTVLEFRRSV